eukprot:449225_1
MDAAILAYREWLMKILDDYLLSYIQLRYRQDSIEVCGHVRHKSRRKNVNQCLDIMKIPINEAVCEGGVEVMTVVDELIKRMPKCIPAVQKSCNVCIYMLVPHFYQHLHHAVKRSFLTNLWFIYFEFVFSRICLH